MKVDNVLGDNIGSIELVDHMGSDLTVVNSARVSFGKRKTQLDESDTKLINFLAKHKHWSPFRHVQFQFHIKAPEIVGRQMYKHIIGADYAFKDHAWNEISGRYVEYDDEFYIPSMYRKQSDSNKQASIGESIDKVVLADATYKQVIRDAYKSYQLLLSLGVCKEQARGVLPISFYTEWYWSASFQAAMNLINLRDKDDVQWETRQYAIAMRELVKPILPISFEALVKNPQ